MESYNTWSLLTGFFHAARFQVSSTLQRVSVLRFFFTATRSSTVEWESTSRMWLSRISFFHSPFDGYSGRFHRLAIRNNAAMSVCLQVSVQAYVFISLECIPWNGRQMHSNNTEELEWTRQNGCLEVQGRRAGRSQEWLAVFWLEQLDGRGCRGGKHGEGTGLRRGRRRFLFCSVPGDRTSF